MTTVLVVGAGLSGLACAHALARANVDVRVLEAGERAGGVVGTVEVDGFRFESGPNTIQASSAEFRALVAELGMLDRLVVSPSNARERYLWMRDRLHTLPGPVGFFTTPLLGWRAKLRVASEPFRAWRARAAGEPEPTMRAFVTERFGPEVATRLAGAFVRGIYAAELDELGARSAFPRLWRACTEHGGVLRAVWAGRNAPRIDLPGPRCSAFDLLSFANGLQEFVDALARELDARLHLGDAAVSLARADAARVDANESAGVSARDDARASAGRTPDPARAERPPRAGWIVHTRSGAAFTADHVVLALPAAATARLLVSASLPADLTRPLLDIGHARVALVHLGLDAAEVPGFPRGFGYLVPPDETGSDAPRVLGTIFGSNLFERRAPQDCHAVTSFYPADLVASWLRERVAEEAARDLARALRLPRPPRVRAHHVMTWNDVIPRYGVGHRERIDQVERELRVHAPGIELAGSFTGGVSVEQVILRGREIARALAARAAHRPENAGGPGRAPESISPARVAAAPQSMNTLRPPTWEGEPGAPRS